MKVLSYSLNRKNGSPTCLLIKSSAELVDGGGDLETFLENCLLALKTNVLGPLDETGQVLLGQHISSYNRQSSCILKRKQTNVEAASALLEEGVLNLLGGRSSPTKRGGEGGNLLLDYLL